LKRGLWLLSADIDPLALAPYLTAPFPSYISAHSALYYHGMISQVPETICCVSSARTGTYRTPLGTYSVHHIPPALFFDYKPVGEPRVVYMATLEKAIVDFLYLKPARSGRFCALPELELPARFRAGHAGALIRRIPDRRRRTMVSRAFESLLKQAQR
jgi:hypothetical protein